MNKNIFKSPDFIYAEIASDKFTGKWSAQPLEGAERINIDPNDYEDFAITQGEIFKVIGGKAVRVGGKADYLAKRQKKHEALIEIQRLKKLLAEMDYKTSKHADGDYSKSEWAIIVAERKEIRLKIKELEIIS